MQYLSLSKQWTEVSEEWRMKSEERSVSSKQWTEGFPILIWGLLRLVVGAICKSPYVGAETVSGSFPIT